jgi:hypothetical protein
VIQGFYFRRRRLFRLLFPSPAPVAFSGEFPPEAASETTDRLAIEQAENEGMNVHAG